MKPGERRRESGALFGTYHRRIYRYVLGIVRDSAEAEDLTQETFLRAHRCRESLRDPRAARGWLYRIATRLCLDRLRQRLPDVSLSGEEEEGRVESVAADWPSALEVAVREETNECVQRCLDLLPDSYRAVMLLYEGHSLTAPQIARLLNESLAAVKMRIHRARRRLQKVMETGCRVSSSERGLPCCEPKL